MAALEWAALPGSPRDTGLDIRSMTIAAHITRPCATGDDMGNDGEKHPGSHGLWTYDVKGGLANDAAWSPDGELLALACYPDFAVVLHGETGKVVRRIDGVPQTPVQALWLPGTGELGIVSSGGAPELTFWNRRTWTRQRAMPLHSGAHPVLSPDGHTVASGSNYPNHAKGAGAVALQDVVTGKWVRDLLGHTSAVDSVAWSPDGARLATASADFSIRIWDVATGETRKVLKVRATAPSVLTWSPDGRTLVSAGSYPPLLLIDPEEGAKRRELQKHGWPVRAVGFAPDGSWLASRDDSGLIIVWRTDADPWVPISRWRPGDLPGGPTAVPLLAVHPQVPRLAQHNDACTGVSVHSLDLAILFGAGV
jgi:WD40 repeat protein